MQPKVSCLCPTFNRAPLSLWLVEEAIMSFLLQDHPNKELLVLNDAPEQRLECDLPGVRVLNSPERFPDLSSKIQAMIDVAEGDILCRWDDDDISLPWRLSLSLKHLDGGVEWRCENHWYANAQRAWEQTTCPVNSHVMSLFSRDVLAKMGGYPPKFSGVEDMMFNRKLVELGFPQKGTLLPWDQVFYVYRWGVSSQHLSGPGGGAAEMQQHYDKIGQRPRASGTFRLRPHWGTNYSKRAAESVERLAAA